MLPATWENFSHSCKKLGVFSRKDDSDSLDLARSFMIVREISAVSTNVL